MSSVIRRAPYMTAAGKLHWISVPPWANVLVLGGQAKGACCLLWASGRPARGLRAKMQPVIFMTRLT